MVAQTSLWVTACALLVGLMHCSAFADPLTDANVLDLSHASVVTAVGSTTVNEFFDSAAVDSDTLASNRGGADVQVLNKSALDGMVSDNQAYNLTTGSNLISSGSFAGASGLSTVIQNSGNNVLIQNATIVNLQVQ